MYFLPADSKSTEQTHNFCTTQVDKNISNRTFYNGNWLIDLLFRSYDSSNKQNNTKSHHAKE